MDVGLLAVRALLLGIINSLLLKICLHQVPKQRNAQVAYLKRQLTLRFRVLDQHDADLVNKVFLVDLDDAHELLNRLL